MNFKYRSSHRWSSLNKVFLKSSQYSRKNICFGVCFNKFVGLQACKFTKKRPQHRCFPVNIANFKNTYFEKHLRTAGSDSYIYCILQNYLGSELAFQIGHLFLMKHKITLFYILSFVFIRFITRCHSLAVIRCHSLSLVVPLVVTHCITRCHSLYHSIIFIVTHYHSLYNLLSFFVTRCHSMSLDVPTTRLSFYERSLFHIFFVYYIIYN